MRSLGSQKNVEAGDRNDTEDNIGSSEPQTILSSLRKDSNDLFYNKSNQKDHDSNKLIRPSSINSTIMTPTIVEKKHLIGAINTMNVNKNYMESQFTTNTENNVNNNII